MSDFETFCDVFGISVVGKFVRFKGEKEQKGKIVVTIFCESGLLWLISHFIRSIITETQN